MRELRQGLAFALDAIHLPFAVLVMALGQLWLPHWFYWPMMFAIMTGQILVMGCPLTTFTCWLRRIDDPDYTLTMSGTAWLYRKFGKAAAIPILLFYSLGGALLYYLWQ